MKKNIIKLLLPLLLLLIFSCENPTSSKKSDDTNDENLETPDDPADETELPVPENFSEMGDGIWIFATTNESKTERWSWTIEGSTILSSYMVDFYSEDAAIESSTAIPADGVMDIVLTTDSEKEFTASFSDANTMTLSDPSGTTFTFHRILEIPSEIALARWKNYSNGHLYTDENIEYGIIKLCIYDIAKFIYGNLISVEGNNLTIMRYNGTTETFRYSVSGSVLILTLDGNTYQVDLIPPIPASLLDTFWSASLEGYTYTIHFEDEYSMNMLYIVTADDHEIGDQSLEISWEDASTIILYEVDITKDGVYHDEVTVYLDISNTAAGIPCTYDGSVAMTFTKD